jgi:hypothetical protein
MMRAMRRQRRKVAVQPQMSMEIKRLLGQTCLGRDSRREAGGDEMTYGN